jgi:uncharacterized protein YeaC (DUF1315 family)
MLVLVFAFMAILMLMSKARDPDTWSWMWALDGPQPENRQAPLAGESAAELDSRPQALPEALPSEPPVVGIDRGPTGLAPWDVDQLPESLQTTQLDGWDAVLTSLDRAQQTLFRVLLWNSRHNTPLDERQRVQWDHVLARLDERWNDFHSRALMRVAEDRDQLSDAQKRVCLEVLEQSKRAWEKQRAALSAAREPQEITVGEREQLTQLQRTLDRRDLKRVEDNTVLRREENEAWFRLWERLEETASRPETPPSASYIQLFSQPSEYRGRLVRVQGEARMAYHTGAGPNPFGIDGYYVFAVRPQEGGDNPLIVYCLDLPQGFPEIKDRDVDRQTTALRENMEFTGYLFKRWVYPSRGGPNLAPLLVARISAWTPRARLAPEADAPPGIPAFLLAAAALAILAAAFAWRVYRASQTSAADFVSPLATGDTVSFDAAQVRPSIEQSLQALTDKPPVIDGPGEE